MSYHDLLYKYGSEQESAETRVLIFTTKPGSLRTAAQVAQQDSNTTRDIQTLERLIEDLKDYRKALAERYAQLETMSYTHTLKLERHRHWKGHVEYIITIVQELEDGTKRDELREVYPGKERHRAIARYKDLQRQRPGISAEMDIEKRQWEK